MTQPVIPSDERPAGLAIELVSEPRLCYAMQQSAVPWLRAVRLRNGGDEAVTDLVVTVDLVPAFARPLEWRVAEVPPGETVELERPDPVLELDQLANLLERVRGELRATVRSAEDSTATQPELAAATAPIEVLAYNEWPGLTVLPALLAAFAQPNHPSLAPLLQLVAYELEKRTGRSALDGYQSGDPERVRHVLAAVHAALVEQQIQYVSAPPSFERIGQKVRPPEQVLGDRLGTCLDLALLFAGLLEHVGLHPVLVLQKAHAFVGVFSHADTTSDITFGPAVELRKFTDARGLFVSEATLVCASGPATFENAERAARAHLDDDEAFVVAIDVAAARRHGIAPLPPRVSAYRAGEPFVAPTLERGVGEAGAARRAAVPARDPEPESAPAVDRGPKDRLEHWKSRLLDLTMFNRLLNFRETRKTIRLCDHDLQALDHRMHTRGRLRIHPRPDLGQDDDPRDLQLSEQRTGVDVRAEFLAGELAGGRLRAEHEPDDLDARLVEIFRHARTTLEESGANTLYLAVGFLRWFETPESTKERRAPLLLLPLLIERTSVQEGFRLTLDDAEPRINRTLLQLLERDFQLEVRLDDVPETDDGVDVEAVLDAFRGVALGMPRWEVELTAQIGFFSFTKYLMWLDLSDRDGLLRSPVLQHLVENPGGALAQEVPETPRDELDDLDPATVYCPKDADSSQLAAVVAGAAGRTFVLEGPPGTGKSQTITNLISQALANEKRVLFVAEKRAALEVVQRRLDSVGLGAFCLELHSSKSGSKAVLEQLRRPLDLAVRREPRGWAALVEELGRERDRLNGYVRAIHLRREHGFSLYWAIGQLVGLRDAPRIAMPELLDGAPADIVSARRAVSELVSAASRLGVPIEEPWWGVRRTDWSHALLRDVVPVAERLQRAALAYETAVADVVDMFALDRVVGGGPDGAGPSRDQLELLRELAERFTAALLPTAAMLRAPDWPRLAAELREVCAIATRRQKLWAPLAERWSLDLVRRPDLDLPALAVRYRRWADTMFLLRWWHLRAAKRQLLPLATAGFGRPLEVRADLERAVSVQQEHARLVERWDVTDVLEPRFRSRAEADWESLEPVAAQVDWVDDVRRLVLKLETDALQPDAAVLAALADQLDALRGGAEVLTRRLGALRTTRDEFEAALGAAQSMLALDHDEAFGPSDAPGHVGNVVARTRRWLADVPQLREQCAYARAVAAMTEFGAAPLAAAHSVGELPAEDLEPAFERTFLEAWLDRIHAQHPDLAMFRGSDHERTVREFRELDRRAIEMAAEVVVARLASRLPRLRDTTVSSSELGILEREIKKQRRHKPVRRLLAEIPGLLARVAPCVLMSPLSVAQFLGRSDMRFDLVVFDEASQIPMWDAVGAIGRGDSLVVVGDSRQLPPTSFFQRLDQGDDLEDDELPDDLESVLDECGAAGLPRMFLDWHYRSRHESLIAFSNHHYYGNRLLTFPAPEPATAGLGVRFVKVDGIYDRGGSQTNRVEAERLVAEVLERLRDPARAQRTIGIVTFSRAQQVLIEDLLDRARADHPEIEPFFSAAEEPLFVKNLENVQGDERDTILFSICYGPDAAGKIYENYGPLNQQGGERRLNVAVTRARRELVVFSSLRADQVATRTAAIGARHLRAFLDYAERGEPALAAAIAADPSGDVESPFEAAVRDALVAKGYEVHPQVGCSGYRIDLSVVDPEAPGSYLLGIECDGATYHSAATARDRDRIRAAVLRGLGWRLHRVWSTDFWQDPAGELERLEEAIARAQQDRQLRRAAVPAAAEGGDEAARVEADGDDAAAVGDEAVPEPEVDAKPWTDVDREADAEPEAGEVIGTTDVAPAAPPPVDPEGPRPYVVARLEPVGGDPDLYAATSTERVREHVRDVLRAEAPIAFDRLARAVAHAWGVTRLTGKVRRRVRDVLPEDAFERDGIVHESAALADAFVGFRVPESEADERPADELPLVEVTNAMRWLLQQHLALLAEDLAREAAKSFGITRLGSVVRGVMEDGLEALVAAGDAERDGEMVRLPD